MPKLLTRIVAFLLVPCVIMDPNLSAAAFCHPPLATGCSATIDHIESTFTQEAFELPLVAAPRQSFESRLGQEIQRKAATSYRSADSRGNPSLVFPFIVQVAALILQVKTNFLSVANPGRNDYLSWEQALTRGRYWASKERFPIEDAPWLELWALPGFTFVLLLWIGLWGLLVGPALIALLHGLPLFVRHDSKAYQSWGQLGMRFLGALGISAFASLALLFHRAVPWIGQHFPDYHLLIHWFRIGPWLLGLWYGYIAHSFWNTVMPERYRLSLPTDSNMGRKELRTTGVHSPEANSRGSGLAARMGKTRIGFINAISIASMVVMGIYATLLLYQSGFSAKYAVERPDPAPIVEQINNQWTIEGNPVSIQDFDTNQRNVIDQSIAQGHTNRAFWQSIISQFPKRLPISSVITAERIHALWQGQQLDNFFNALRANPDALYRFLTEIKGSEMTDFCRHFATLKPGTRQQVMTIFYRRLRHDLAVLENGKGWKVLFFKARYIELARQVKQLEMLYRSIAQILNTADPISPGTLPVPTAPPPSVSFTESEAFENFHSLLFDLISDYERRGYQVVMPSKDAVNEIDVTGLIGYYYSGNGSDAVPMAFLEDNQAAQLLRWVLLKSDASRFGAHRISDRELLEEVFRLYAQEGSRINLFKVIATIGHYYKALSRAPELVLGAAEARTWLDGADFIDQRHDALDYVFALDPANRFVVDDKGRPVLHWRQVDQDGNDSIPAGEKTGILRRSTEDIRYHSWNFFLTAFYTQSKTLREILTDKNAYYARNPRTARYEFAFEEWLRGRMANSSDQPRLPAIYKLFQLSGLDRLALRLSTFSSGKGSMGNGPWQAKAVSKDVFAEVAKSLYRSEDSLGIVFAHEPPKLVAEPTRKMVEGGYLLHQYALDLQTRYQSSATRGVALWAATNPSAFWSAVEGTAQISTLADQYHENVPRLFAREEVLRLMRSGAISGQQVIRCAPAKWRSILAGISRDPAVLLELARIGDPSDLASLSFNADSPFAVHLIVLAVRPPGYSTSLLFEKYGAIGQHLEETMRRAQLHSAKEIPPEIIALLMGDEGAIQKAAAILKAEALQAVPVTGNLSIDIRILLHVVQTTLNRAAIGIGLNASNGDSKLNASQFGISTSLTAKSPAINESHTAGSWLPWRRYKRYLAGAVEPAVVLGITGRIAANIIWTHFSDPASLVGVIALTVATASIVALVSALWFRYFHLVTGQVEAFRSREVRELAWETAGVGALLGAAIALPTSFGLISLALWAAATFSAAGLIYRHFVINRQATESLNEIELKSRRAVVWNMLGYFGGVLSGTFGLSGTILPSFDRKIDYLRTSESLKDELRTFGHRKYPKALYGLGPETMVAVAAEAKKFGASDIEQLQRDVFARISKRPSIRDAQEATAVSDELAALLARLRIAYLYKHRLIEHGRSNPINAQVEMGMIRAILAFLLDPQWMDIPSFAARENIAIAKVHAIRLIRYWLVQRPTAPEVRRLMWDAVRGLLEMLSHREHVAHSDASFARLNFPSEELLLNELIQDVLESSLASLLNPETRRSPAMPKIACPMEVEIAAWLEPRVPENRRPAYPGYFSGKELGVYHMWIRPYGRFQEYRQFDAMAERAAREPTHTIPISLIHIVKELRLWPKSFVSELKKTGAMERIPPEVLATPFLDPEDNSYSARELVHQYVDRHPQYEWILPLFDHLPVSWQRQSMPNRWQDFLGGVVAVPSAHSSMGAFQLRDSTVRLFNLGLERAPDNVVEWMLLDPAANIKVWGRLWRMLIGQTELLRELAVDNAGQFEKEFKSITGKNPIEIQLGLAMDFSAQTYSALPSLDSLEKSGNAWRLAELHPAYHWKMFVHPAYLVALRVSGIFDDRPAYIAGVQTRHDIDQIAELLHGDDPWLRDAAVKTLERVCADSSHPELQKWANNVLRLDRLSSSNLNRPGNLGAGMAALGVATFLAGLVEKNPTMWRRAFFTLSADRMRSRSSHLEREAA